MDIFVIALSINPRPLSAFEVKLSGLIMESRVDTKGDNQNAHVIISNYPHDGHANKWCYWQGSGADSQFYLYFPAFL